MNINIFGVGRSGTKALQLMIAYALLQKHPKIWLNYEPYYWQTSHNIVSWKGIKMDWSNPIFTTDVSELSTPHQNYLKNLAKHEIPIVTKFIRGNGRVNAINQIMKPDFTFGLIRPLEEVLNSVVNTTFNFLTIGNVYFKNTYRNRWEEFYSAAYKKNLISHSLYNNYVKKIGRGDIVTQNAIYWYVMNKSLLTNEVQDRNKIYYIRYDDLDKTDIFIKNILGINVDFKNHQERFIGSNIHRTYPICPSPLINNTDKIKERINELSYTLMNMFSNNSVYLFKGRAGHEVILNLENKKVIDNENIKRNKVKIINNNMFDEFNSEIMESLEKVKILF